jgi:pyridoxal phosphate enzyme (YggS family)
MGAAADGLTANIRDVREQIARACARSGRDAADVTLVAASKSVPAAVVRRAREAGIADFGENYARELRAKRDAAPDARWHFIGTLQTSSAHHVALLADVVQTIAGGRAMERLARRAAAGGREIDAMIEVDFTGERTGVAPREAPSLADAVAALGSLRLVGLMTLPPMPEYPDDARASFVRLRELRDRIRESHPQVLELSMGMSLDYRVAVEEGATMVRIGTALFGPRATLT